MGGVDRALTKWMRSTLRRQEREREEWEARLWAADYQLLESALFLARTLGVEFRPEAVRPFLLRRVV